MQSITVKEFPGPFPQQGRMTDQRNGVYTHPANPDTAIIVHRGRVFLCPGMAHLAESAMPITLREVRSNRLSDGFYHDRMLPDALVLVRKGLPYVLAGMLPNASQRRAAALHRQIEIERLSREPAANSEAPDVSLRTRS